MNVKSKIVINFRENNSGYAQQYINPDDLYKEYHRLIYYIIQLSTIPEDSHNEILNQVFLKIIKGLDNLRTKKNIKAWVTTITKNEIYAYFKKRSFEIKNNTSIDKLPMKHKISIPHARNLFQQEEEIFNKHLRSIVKNIVSRLEDDIREPFLLRYKHGLKWKQVSNLLDLPIDTARKRADRAKKVVLRSLSRIYGFSILH